MSKKDIFGIVKSLEERSRKGEVYIIIVSFRKERSQELLIVPLNRSLLSKICLPEEI